MSFKKRLLNGVEKNTKEDDKCFDCSQSGTYWAVVNYAIFICIECAGRHRAYGTHISSVKSPILDKWSEEERSIMKAGGNYKAKLYFESHFGPLTETLLISKYHSEIAQRYTQILKQSASSEKESIFPEKEICEDSLLLFEDSKKILRNIADKRNQYLCSKCLKYKSQFLNCKKKNSNSESRRNQNTMDTAKFLCSACVCDSIFRKEGLRLKSISLEKWSENEISKIFSI